MQRITRVTQYWNFCWYPIWQYYTDNASTCCFQSESICVKNSCKARKKHFICWLNDMLATKWTLSDNEVNHLHISVHYANITANMWDIHGQFGRCVRCNPVRHFIPPPCRPVLLLFSVWMRKVIMVYLKQLQFLYRNKKEGKSRLWRCLYVLKWNNPAFYSKLRSHSFRQSGNFFHFWEFFREELVI